MKVDLGFESFSITALNVVGFCYWLASLWVANQTKESVHDIVRQSPTIQGSDTLYLMVFILSLALMTMTGSMLYLAYMRMTEYEGL